MWLDSRGRLFGKLSLLDLLACLFLFSVAGVIAYAVRVSRYRALEIASVEPRRIVAGPRQFAVVRGSGFDPATTARLGENILRKNVRWEESVLGIEINEEVPPGVYALWVRDSHGRTATLQGTLEVVWEPKISEVKPRIIYSTGEGARLDITGSYFSRACTVRLGDQEVPADRHSSAPTRMLSADFSQGPPVPPGQHRLTVTNPEGQSTTWEGVVTVMPAPEITSVTPDWIALGDSVDLVFYGRNFREGTHVRLSEERIGEATWVSSERLKIRLKTNPRLAGKACDVFFKLRDGPEVKVGTSLVRVSSSCLVFMVATVLLDEASANVVREFRDSLEWKLRRPLGQLRIPGRTRNYNISPPPVFEVLLPAQITVERGELISSAWARPFHQGSRIWFHINGQELSGLVLSEPFAVFSEDYFENKRMQ